MEGPDSSDRLVRELRDQPQNLAYEFLGERVAWIRPHVGIRYQFQNFTSQSKNHCNAPQSQLNQDARLLHPSRGRTDRETSRQQVSC